MKIFRPKRITDFSELPDWIFKTSKKEAEEMHKRDNPKELQHGEKRN